jgi:hypothetical protein
MKEPLEEISVILDPLSPFKKAEVLDDLLTKYGVPRTFMLEVLTGLDIPYEDAEALINENAGRTPNIRRND